jgi:ABC-2 type transport system permease protein
MIRASFAAVPQRRLPLGANAVVVAIVTLVVSEAASFVAFLAGQAILSARSLQVGLSSPGALRSVIGAGLYLTVLALLALSIGSIARHSAGAIAALFGLLPVLPGATEPLPHSWQNAINPYLPSYAGQAITSDEDLHLLAPGPVSPSSVCTRRSHSGRA